MFRRLTGIVILSLCFAFINPDAILASEQSELTISPGYKNIAAKVVKRIPLPKWYHEGLFYGGSTIWVANGKKGKTWVVDLANGNISSEITPVAGFTEGITKVDDGIYAVTEWDAKKVYKVRIEGGKMIPLSEVSCSPAHPAGLVWTGDRLFVITWTRGMGTKFDLLEMNKDLELVRKVRIKAIQEPAHMAWDGKSLWITSWYSHRIYKVDLEIMRVVGFFVSPVSLTTGITWDGRYIWVTGTYADLYQMATGDMTPAEGGVVEIKVASSAFENSGLIPKKYTCDGEELSPPLAWSAVPPGTKSIAVISDDPDAPSGTWVHWVLFNVPPDVSMLSEGVPRGGELKDGARQGITDSGDMGYSGPCPPSGTHRYYFKVYALDSMLELKPGSTKEDLLACMDGHILAKGEIMGKYRRK